MSEPIRTLEEETKLQEEIRDIIVKEHGIDKETATLCADNFVSSPKIRRSSRDEALKILQLVLKSMEFPNKTVQ